MIPLADVCTRIDGRDIVPAYLREGDHAWLSALLGEHARFVGQRRGALTRRLEEPLPVPAPRGKLRMAVRVLERMTRSRISSPIAPQRAREQVFVRATELSRAGLDPRLALAEIGASEGLEASDVQECLLADLPTEQRLVALPSSLTAHDLATQVNHALVTALLRRSRRLELQLWGGARAVVRHAQRVGLIAVASRLTGHDARADGGGPGTLLEVSGPLALFRRTRLYGGAFASLVGAMTWCTEARAQADCVIDGVDRRLVLQRSDPVCVGKQPAAFDSRVEERFARDFARLAPDWTLLREPEAIEVGGRLVFPDFALCHRRHPSRSWLLEIVGFWTPEYLTRKLAALRAIAGGRFIVCADAKLGVGREHHVPGEVIAYRRRIDVREVIRLIEG